MLRDDNEIFTRLTPDDRVAPAFAGVRSSIVVCGHTHTHMQFDRRVERAAARIRASKYPAAEEFASSYVLRPPSERQMLELFEKAQPKQQR